MKQNLNYSSHSSLTDTHSPLFPAIEPYQTGYLAVDELHTLYWEECGTPNGIPVLVLHGGPGAGLAPQHRQFFDPQSYRIILFDQRGAGKSSPLGEYKNNTTQLLIQDIETIRQMLSIEKWLVFGGSWGSTLALAYGQAHPERCTGFVLRGIFLCTAAEFDWFLYQIKWFYPAQYEQFISHIPLNERDDLLSAYSKRLFSEDPEVYVPAAQNWSKYEGSCLHLLPHPEVADSFESIPVALGVGRLEAHYFKNLAFLTDDQLINNVHKIEHLPAVIVQGRYDVVCPPFSAYRLHQAWPSAVFKMIEDAGHSAFEAGISSALVKATEAFKTQSSFI